MISNYQHLDKKKKKTRKQTNNNSLATAAGWQRFQFHTSHTSVLPSFSRKRQFQDSVTNQLPFSRSEQLLQAGLPWKKKKNTGGDQEETEPGRQQPRTMKPIRPRWEQTPPTFEPVKCNELERKISWLVAKMAGYSEQLEGEYVSVDACLSLCGPVVNFPRGLTGCNNGDWLPVQDKYWWKTDALQWNAHSLDIYYHRQSTKIYTLVVGGCVRVSPQWRSRRDFSTRKVVKDTRDPAGLPRQRVMRQKTGRRSCPHAVVFIELPCTQCANVLVTWLFIAVYCARAELRESWAVAGCHAEMLPRGVEPFDTSERFVWFHPNCTVHSC